MDFDLSPEQEELQNSVRGVLHDVCPISLVRAVVETGEPAEEPWRSAVALGWTAVAIPERFGGLGLSFEELGLVVEEHGRALAPGPFLATVTQFAPLVAEAGSDAQRERWLSAVAAGTLTGAFAATGGRAGLPSDAALVATRRGDGLRLDGETAMVLSAESADEIAVAARIESGDGVALCVVPGEAVTRRRVVSLDASRPLAHLAFRGVEVPPERVLGPPGGGAPALARALDAAQVALALETAGACEALLERCVEFARDRVQFERVIGSFQAVQHKLADMLVQVEKARASAWFAMMTLAEDDPRRHLAASLAKVAAGDCQRLLAKEAIQIHGGTGFTWECDVHLFVRRIKTCEALFGTSGEHREQIARALLDARAS